MPWFPLLIIVVLALAALEVQQGIALNQPAAECATDGGECPRR